MLATLPIHDPGTVRPQHQDAAEVAIRDLRDPIRDAPRSEAFTTFFAAVITFGLYPAVMWPLRFRQVIDAERRRFGRLAQWLEARGRFDNLAAGTHPVAPRLRISADAIRFRPFLYLIGFASCAAWVLLFFACGGRLGSHHSLLMASTYSSHPALLADNNWAILFLHRGPYAPLWAVRDSLFAAWVAALSLAFVTHWAQVQLHAGSVRRFLDEFNKIAIDEGLSPVFLSPVGSGVRPMWVAGALVMAWMNAPWGIPLMLAGSVQRRYVVRVGPDMRSALATRVREMTLLPRPATVPPVPRTARNAVDVRARCTTEGCRQPVPAVRGFARVAAGAAPRVDRVA